MLNVVKRQLERMQSEKKYTCYLPGRRGGIIYAEAMILKKTRKRCLIFSYTQMDALIAYGVQPSQLHLEGELYPIDKL